jgi:hypothetical protein
MEQNNILIVTGVPDNGIGNTISGIISNGSGVTQTTTFNITGTAANGCSGTTTATIHVYATELAPVISEAQTVCIFSTPAALTGTAATGGSGSFLYQWQSSPITSTGQILRRHNPFISLSELMPVHKIPITG